MSVAQTLSPARELVATNAAHFPNESVRYIARLEMRSSLKKSNCAATSNRWQHSGARYPMAERSRTTSKSSPKLVPFASPACSAIKTH